MSGSVAIRGRLAARRYGVGVVLLLATLVANAHQQKESVTRVLFNPRTGNIEVMHRFLVHDAEHAVKLIVGTDADILESNAARERFAAYVHSQFSLADQSGTEIPLVPVGQEIDGRFLWIYAESPVRDSVTALTLSHNALREIWPEQVNLVNVDRNGATRSAVLGGNDRKVTVELP